MAYMYTGENDRLVIHRQICQFANAILKMDNQMIKVSVISERILQDALKHTITRVADRISECECIQKFAEYMEISFDEAVRLLAQFVEFVCILTLLIMFFHGIICLLKEWLNEKNMP